MIGRVTQTSVFRELQASIGRLQRKLAGAQEIVSSQKRLLAPSDDPTATARVERLRAQATELGAFRDGVGFARAALGATDGALEQVDALVTRAREIAVQHAGGFTTPASRQAAAEEVTELERGLIALGNTAVAGRYIFGGLQSGSAPFVGFDDPGFDPTTAYVGPSTPFSIAVDRDHVVQVSTPGGAALDAALTAIDDLRQTLAAGAAPAGNLAALETAGDTVRQERANVGARAGRLAGRDQEIVAQVEEARKLLSETEDADLTQSVSELVQLQSALEATLAAGTRLMQTSILDFLRL
jgi:flagellar hook-associated protein 3 FlgL